MKRRSVKAALLLISLVAVLDMGSNGLGIFDNGPRIRTSENISKNQGDIGPHTPNAIDSGALTRNVKGKSLLMINNPGGKISIFGSDSEDLNIDYQLTVYADKEEMAQEYLRRLSVEVKEEGSTIEVHVKGNYERFPGIRGIRVDYIITGPRDLDLELTNRFGPVKISGFNSQVKAENSYDLLRAEDIHGNVHAKCRYGELEVHQVTGDTVINSEFKGAKLSEISGNVELYSKYSSTNLKDVKGSLHMESKFGEIYLKNIGGDLKVQNEYGNIEGYDLYGPVDIQSAFSNITLEGLNESTTIKSRYGNIHVKLPSKGEGFKIWARTKYGDIKEDMGLERSQPTETSKEARGTIGEGKYLLNLNADFSDILLEF